MPLPQFEGLVPPLNEDPASYGTGSFQFPQDTEWMATILGVLRIIIERENWDITNENNIVADMDKIIAIAEIIYYSIAFTGGGTMSCADIADCIETDADVLAALLAQLVANGYTQNPASAGTPVLPSVTSGQSAASLITGLTDCSDPAQVMAIARAVVRELHESTEDAFELFELQTNAVEASGIALGFIPAAGTAANLVEFVNWTLETLVETYQAAYTQSAEDTIACAIFCHMLDTCTLSYDDLVSIYKNLGSLTVPSLENIQDVLQFAIDTAITVDTTGVAIWHYHLLRMIKFGETYGVSFNNVKTAIKAASVYQDYTYQDVCDDCPPAETPTSYWMLRTNFASSKSNWLNAQAPAPVIFQNDGVMSATISGISRLQIAWNFDGSFALLCGGQKEQRFGATGSGGNDIATITGFSLPNGGGTARPLTTASFLTETGYPLVYGDVDTTPTATCQSVVLNNAVNGATVYPSRFCLLTEVAIYGVPNGTVKPTGAVWVSALPTSLAEMFP